MNKNKIIGLLILSLFVVLPAIGTVKAHTETAINDSFTLEGGYFKWYDVDILKDNLDGRIVIHSSASIKVFICDSGDWEAYKNNQFFSHYKVFDGIVDLDFHYTFHNHPYEFIISNEKVASATVTFTLTFDDHQLSTGVIILIILGVLAFIAAGVVAFILLRKR